MSVSLARSVVFFLLVPGLAFTAVAGLLVSWVDRKVTARLQWREGPPLLQPFYDFFKLLGKETVMPAEAPSTLFLFAPFTGLAGVTLAVTLIGVAVMGADVGFEGDLIVLLYLLAMPALAVILGGIASCNPLAAMGAGREMKLMFAYELPLILVLMVVIIRSDGLLRLGELAAYQAQNGAIARSLSGALALVVAILCMQAKLALVPFDQSEAETEIMSGALIEYGGPPLAVYKLTKAMMLVAMPLFVVFILWGGFGNSAGSALLGVLKYLALVVLVILLRNTNPRLRIEHAVRFFWGPVAVLAVLAVFLAALGA